MPDPDFSALRSRLVRSGLPLRRVHDSILEIKDHYQDLLDEGAQHGLPPVEAERYAQEALGNLEDLGQVYAAQPELRGWAHRWPRVALCVYPIACLVALPAIPLVIGMQNPSGVVRWAGGLLGAGVVTASLLLSLQLLITFA